MPAALAVLVGRGLGATTVEVGPPLPGDVAPVDVGGCTSCGSRTVAMGCVATPNCAAWHHGDATMMSYMVVLVAPDTAVVSTWVRSVECCTVERRALGDKADCA